MVEKKPVAQAGMRIEELPVNPQAVLTGETKTRLVKIIEAEFEAQSTVYNSQIQEEQDKILARHKKRLGVDRFIKELEAIDERVRLLKEKEVKILEKMKELPFDRNNRFSEYNLTPEGTKEYNTIKAELDAVGLKHPMNLKNKIITRLLIATTVGEALVILRQVLGNGVLPSMTREQLALPELVKAE